MQPHEDEWILVVDRKKEKTGSKKSSKQKRVVHTVSSPPFDPEQHTQMLEKVKTSSTAKLLAEKLKSKLRKQTIKSVHVQALGLGNIVKDKKPRIQFQLCKNILDTLLEQQIPLSLNIYDPVFDSQCINLIKKSFDPKIQISIDHYGQSARDTDTLQILYMPHCEKSLYKQVLQSQRGTIKSHNNLVLIGNSLTEYLDRERIMGLATTQIFRQCNFGQTPVPDYEGAFNDTYYLQI